MQISYKIYWFTHNPFKSCLTKLNWEKCVYLIIFYIANFKLLTTAHTSAECGQS